MADLSKGKLGADKSNLLGALLVTQFQLAAMARADMPENERRDFFLYVDEFQSFATDSFVSILSEARKYRLSLTLSHQYPDGRLIGYAGRVVDDSAIAEDNPRYRFPGEREREGKVFEFRKTLFLYSGFRFKTPLDDLIVVEGFASIWWLFQNGLPHAVATMGADCSEHQAKLIVSLVKPMGRVWVIPDGNEAGERCALAIFRQVSPHRFVRWVKLADGKQRTDLSREQLKTSFTM